MVPGISINPDGDPSSSHKKTDLWSGKAVLCVWGGDCGGVGAVNLEELGGMVIFVALLSIMTVYSTDAKPHKSPFVFMVQAVVDISPQPMMTHEGKT